MRIIFVITWLMLGLALLVVGLVEGAWEPLIGYSLVMLVLGFPIGALLWEMDP